MSRAGGYLTVLLLILSLLSFVAFSRDFVYMLNPVYSVSEEVNPQPYLKNKNIFFAIAPVLSGSVEIKEVNRYLDIQFGIIDTDGSRNSTDKAYYSFFGSSRCSENNTQFLSNSYNLSSFLAASNTSYFCPSDEHSKYDLISN